MSNDPRVFDLVYWITERYAIKMRRDKNDGPPWSLDPAMADVRYCNVHREDDAVTKWVRENWNMPGDKAWKFALGRLINYVPTLDWILRMPHDTLTQVSEQLKFRRQMGEKVFTSVYTISTCGEKIDKIDYVMRLVRDIADTEAASPWNGTGPYDSLDQTARWLKMFQGLGDFLSGQIIADMKNTVGHPLHRAPDWWNWCAPGPGSIKGLKCFFPGRRITPASFRDNMDKCRSLVNFLLPNYIPIISAQDFQNCLCEFSKYYRVKYECGHVRNRYHG